MTIMFWIIALLMAATAVTVLLRSLLRVAGGQDPQRQSQNIRIARERLAELQQELESGLLAQADYQQARQELEQVLLSDLDMTSGSTPRQLHGRSVAWGVMVFIPVFSIAGYLLLGQPQAITIQSQQAASLPQGHPAVDGNSKLPSVEEMVARLAKRLESQPNDAEGWYMLGRSYMSMGQYQEAVQALAKARQLLPANPQILLRYADALTMLRNGRISGEPFEMIKQALQLSPNDPTGLWLAGMGYEEQGDHQQAIDHWQRLLPLLKDQPSIQRINEMIAQARQALGQPATAQTMPTPPVTTNVAQQASGIKVHISLDPTVLDKVARDDTVFIFARAEQGPPMPLAVVRKRVRDLPLDVVLNDSMAMMPSMKISSFDRIRVEARISRSGQAKAQPGDWQSNSASVANTTADVIQLKISQQVP